MSYAKTALKGLIYCDNKKADDGYTLLQPYSHDVLLINQSGEIVHKWFIPYTPGTHAVLLPNGHLFYAAYNRKNEEVGLDPEHAGLGGMFIELDWDSNLVWKMEVPFQHHSFAIDPITDNIIFSTYHPDGIWPDELAIQIKGGIPNTEFKGKLWGDVVYEINRAGEIIWEWIAWKHLDPAFENLSHLERRVICPYINAIRIMQDGDLLFSGRHVRTVFKVNRKSGDIVARYGRSILAHQHDARELPNGNIMVFNNGIQRSEYENCYSSVIEIDPKTDKVVWEYRTPEANDFFSPICAGAQRLSNGNTIICESVLGRIFQISPEKEIVWEYISPFLGFNLGRESTMLWNVYYYEKDFPSLQGRILDAANYPKENRLFGPPSFVTSFDPIII